MIIIGLIVSLVGMFLLAVAWRGRVVALGEYCRACKFDLAGLDIESDQAQCPECGGGVYSESDRRGLLRKPIAIGLVIGSAMLVSGLASLGFSSTGKANVLLGVLPDTTIFWLNDLGFDEALDELVVRVSRSTNPIADELLASAIADALAHQADLTQVWDPRWGEVLSISFGNPLMSDDQMFQYLRNGMDIGVVIRDRVHQGSSSVSINLTTAYGRISAVNFNNNTGYMYTIKASSGGVVGEEPRPMGINGGMSTNLTIPNRANSMSMRTNGKVEPTGIGFDVEPGTSVMVFVEYELILRKLGVAQTYRTEQAVLVVDPDEAIVPILNDPKMAQAFCESFMISHVRVLDDIPEQVDNFGLRVLSLQAQYNGLPASIALNVFIDLGDGELVNIGLLVQQGPAETKGGRVNWRMKPFETQESTPYAEIITRLIELGQVDVIFETDATLADLKPGIEEVLEFSIRFKDIPVEAFAEKDSIRYISYSPTTQSYSADNPKTWYEGICEPEE